MRHCWYKVNDNASWVAGIFHAWSMDSEGNGLIFPVGIIEDEKTGKIQAIYVNRICFRTVPPV